jgi:hypothetical protein
MAGYLEAYGVGEAKRERTLKRILLVTLVVAVVGGSLYLFFRNYFEVRKGKLFLEQLHKQDYRSAYQLWCPPSKPCRDYPLDKFMEDWGPKSPHADPSTMHIVKTRGCTEGVILQIGFGKGSDEYLWVTRNEKLIGFAPWEGTCNPARLLRQH